LVISGRTEVGYGACSCETGSIKNRLKTALVLDQSQAVYAVKSVGVIPLTEPRAREALRALSARNTVNPRLSLVPTADMTHRESVDDVPSNTDVKDSNTPRVTFASEQQVKVMTPTSNHGFESEHSDDESESASSPSDSAISTPSLEFSVMTGNIAKTLTDRLSFWNKMSRRQSATTIEQTLLSSSEQHTEPSRQASAEERTSIDAMITKDDREPSEILDTILNIQSAPPASVEQKNSELEEKIIKEVVHQFSRGGMYFAYHFGRYSCRGRTHGYLAGFLDITRSLQQKQELIARAKKQSSLLADLNAVDDQNKLSPDDGKVHVLGEPSATLPLWRRVDRQFWWNEWLSKSFLDAGVCCSLSILPSVANQDHSFTHTFCLSCKGSSR
jgi:phosphatidylinositol 4-phosphatase